MGTIDIDKDIKEVEPVRTFGQGLRNPKHSENRENDIAIVSSVVFSIWVLLWGDFKSRENYYKIVLSLQNEKVQDILFVATNL